MGDASSLFFLSPNGAVSEDPEAGDERVMAARQTEAARAWRIVRIWFDAPKTESIPQIINENIIEKIATKIVKL